LTREVQSFIASLDVPDSRVWCIGTNLPTEAIEANALQGVQINAFEAPRVDHVVLGLRARTVEGGDAAVAAEVVYRTPSTELICRQGVLSLQETESIRRDHVVEIALTPADRAIALAHPRKLGSDLELDPTTMA
jgi:hypothetical protein